MKQWITLLTAAAIFTSCSKQNLQEESLQQQNIELQSAAFRSGETGTYVSEWEQYSDWQKRDSSDVSIFYRERALPQYSSQVANGGLVLTFAKAGKAVPNYEQYQTPQSLDFHIIAANFRTREGVYFLYDKPAAEKLTIACNLPLTSGNTPLINSELSLNDFQFQYMVLSAGFLAQNELNEQNIRGLSYNQLMNLMSQ
jgi:hypothetical protein